MQQAARSWRSPDAGASTAFHGGRCRYQVHALSASGAGAQATMACHSWQRHARVLATMPSPTRAGPVLTCLAAWQRSAAPCLSPTGRHRQRASSTRCRDAPPVSWLSRVELGDGADGVSLSSMELDAVLILAGGLLPDGGLPEWVTRRLDAAHDIHVLQDRRPPLVCLGAGTPHKPDVVQPNGHVLHESTSCAQYLLRKGVSAKDILKESSSYDTVGNAYFSLTIHAIPAAWQRIAVVTSAFHMARTRALFADLYAMAGSSLYSNPQHFQLYFCSASDDGVFDDHVIAAREGKEAAAVANWRRARKDFTINTLADFHRWFYATHRCYSVTQQHLFGEREIADERLLASY